MSIDITTEHVIRLTEAARMVGPGRQNRPTSVCTVYRWILTGLKSPSGELVKLEGIRLGDKWVTSKEAMQRFAERLTPDVNVRSAPAPRTARQRQRAVERVERELLEAGI